MSTTLTGNTVSASMTVLGPLSPGYPQVSQDLTGDVLKVGSSVAGSGNFGRAFFPTTYAGGVIPQTTTPTTSHGARKVTMLAAPLRVSTTSTYPGRADSGWAPTSATFTTVNNYYDDRASIRLYTTTNGPFVQEGFVGIGSQTEDFFFVKGSPQTNGLGRVIAYSPTTTVAPTTIGTPYSTTTEFPTATRNASAGVTSYNRGTMILDQAIVGTAPSGIPGDLFKNYVSTAGIPHAGLMVTGRSSTPTYDYAAIQVHIPSPSGTRYYMKFTSTSVPNIGTITSPGTTTSYTSVSDYRLKNDVQDITNSLDIVEKLKPRVWTWAPSNEPGVGFIAHEVQESISDAISQGIVIGEKDASTRIGKLVREDGTDVGTTNEDGSITPQEFDYTEDPDVLALWEQEGLTWVETGTRPVYQTMDPSFLIAPLVGAVKELSAKNTALEQRVQELETRVSALENPA